MIGEHATVLITGVSSGLGKGLAEAYLAQGARVLGISRRSPDLEGCHGRFVFQSADLADEAAARKAIMSLLGGAPQLELVILNAGILSPFADMADVSLQQLRHVMDVNVWANKTVLDTLFATTCQVRQVVTISSGASVNGNRGWNGYSISKAALNMLTQLYAREHPQIHFSALAPGLIDTAMQETLCGLPADERFAALKTLRAKRGTDEMPGPREAARRLLPAIARLPEIVGSGGYADVRRLPRLTAC